MFIVKKVTTVERYCPNGHNPMPDLFPLSNQLLRFCHVCGMPIKERHVLHDAAYCTDCYNPVDSSWDYCPCCGQERGD